MKAEVPVIFECAGDRLVGILYPGRANTMTGVVIVVGGPQFRIGSHRQFVCIARNLAGAGIPVLRFDYRGMGDSEGQPRSFEAVDEDIRAAIDFLMERLPELKQVVLFGLCDAASANIMYAPSDDRVAGLILLNPWVRTVQSEAKTYLRHYYLQRLLHKAFWRKVFGGHFSLSKALRELLASVRNALANGQARPGRINSSVEPFVIRMRIAIQQFRKPILVLISGRDLTAREFVDLCRSDTGWGAAIGRNRVATKHFPEANHTMTESEHLDLAGSLCTDWIKNEVLARASNSSR